MKQSPLILSSFAKGQKTKIQIIKEIQKFITSEFDDSEIFFVILYGSYAYDEQTDESDIDLLFVSEFISENRQSRCIEFLIQLHEKLHLPLDNEIRYEHKVLLSLDFFKECLSGRGFRDIDNRLSIPVIIKDREYLDSLELRWRFFHGLMLHQHDFIAGDYHLYKQLKNNAIDLIIAILTKVKKTLLIDEFTLINIFMEHMGAEGDYYLGFKKSENHIEYLRRFCFERIIKLLEKKNIDCEEGLFRVEKLWKKTQ